MHRMRLRPRWFDLLTTGHKTVEIRLHDERRAAVRLGDSITFSNTDTRQQTVAEVIGLRRFASFAAALDAIPTAAVAGPGADRATAEAELTATYSPADEAHHGVLAITMQVAAQMHPLS
ncbi:hypothetical protein Cme02nite_00750 [Catellatospora methionotrophica]|uniref:ASCH domain-containing protein n=2 Tax=Catellatospora methionotrophica TaxID=121620 RepID=A0A8J3L4P8_9ACTN|nr:hypothetical protein Cme02nite_00750 [Catellatospora methionotrophica]